MSFLKEYTLLGELGKGGFAKVYKVRHNELGYIRAIRVLNEPITDEHSKTYQKFLHECKVLLRLGNGSHRNIVHIYQPRLLDNHALVEMDYVDGQDVTHYLKENGCCLPVEEVMRMVEEMSNALAYCHEDIYQFCMDPDEDDLQNDPIDGSKWLIDETTKKKLIEKYKVIHNDIHSGNIMRRRDGSFVLLDFGLAIEGDEVVKSSSRHENGAPEYMPPEKWDNDTILTEQSDIYSFGVVMYEYLAGRVPFVCEGDSFNARTKLYDKIKNSTSLPSIFDLRKSFFEEKYKGETYSKDYPDWLETAIMKCLEKDPSKRFRNGKDLSIFVEKHLHNEAIAKESVQSLSDEIVSLKKERKQTLAQIADLTKRNDDLAILFDTTSHELEQSRHQCEGLEKQLERSGEEKKELEDKIAKLKASRRTSLILCVCLGVIVVVMGFLYADKGGDSVPGDYDTLKAENAELIKTNNVLQDSATNYGKQIDDLNAQIVGLNAEINDLKNEKPTSSDREKELQAQLNQANSKAKSLEELIKAKKDAEIKRLKTTNQLPSSRENELQNQLEQAKSRIEALEAENKEKQRLIDVLNGQL